MKMSNMRIGMRLGGGFGAVCLLLLSMLIVSNLMMSRINASTDEIVNDRLPKIEATTQILVGVNEVAIALRNMMLTDDLSDRQAQVQRIMATRQLNQAAMDKLEATLKDPRAREMFAQMKIQIGRYRPGQDRLISLVQENRPDDARKFLTTELRPILQDLKQATIALATRQKELSASTAAAAASTFHNSQLLTWSLGAVALALGAAIAYAITVSITRPPSVPI